MKKILLLFVAIAIASCQKDKEPIDPWDAPSLVEQIATNQNWEDEYSDANITEETKFVDEYGGVRTVMTLYPGTLDELTVIYNDSLPQELYWNKSGQWTTPYGKVGDPIEVLQKANNAPISFYGLGYDLPGKVKIDSGQIADKKITYTVRPTSDVIPSEYYSYNSFDLSSKESQDLKLFINRIQIEIPKTATTTQ
ncbi:hypothetical protein SAMN05192588_2202 [Nonlabens sp. Hel1_33_55]|uniref:hypothetical protein n=1 Tax=Nonlabens sp. Hel1_33_55 TaxID=1336802 RepID=UPI000875AF07|nr:hypothetical protein [Nonlabens sp. Hel1_33_55]SCY31394.1 hypothetical protein SAMN05192588_2202 [Nonlabens sp. Hel1_33_55]